MHCAILQTVSVSAVLAWWCFTALLLPGAQAHGFLSEPASRNSREWWRNGGNGIGMCGGAFEGVRGGVAALQAQLAAAAAGGDHIQARRGA
jgi:hypothetical protein